MTKHAIHRLLLATLLATATLAAAKAQSDFRQRQLSMDDGLPSNSVPCIVQDQRGFVWMGTEGGLCRYDGRTVADYVLPEKASQHITALLPMGEGTLYVGTTDGVYRLLLKTEQLEPLPLSLSKPVSRMAADNDGNLWVATMGQGIVSCRDGSDQPRQYAMADCGGMVNHVYADQQNQVWALTSQGLGGIWRLNKDKDLFEPAPLANAQDAPTDPTCMVQTDDRRRWVGTWEHGLWQLTDDQRLLPVPAPATGHSLHIHSMTRQSAHELLLCCDDGLWLFNTSEQSFTLSLPQRFVNAAMRDSEGGLWVSTRYGGVSYVSPLSRRFNATPGGLITRFAEDSHGHVWVAGNESGLGCYERGGRQPVGFKGQAAVQHLNVRALCFDGDDLWIGTYASGLFVLSTPTGRLRPIGCEGSSQRPSDLGSQAIYRDRKGRLWVATGEGLCLYNRAADRLELKERLTATAIDIDEDAKGRLWVSTQGGGLVRLDANGQIKAYRHDASQAATLSDDIVNCTLCDREGRLWVATQGGLCLYDDSADSFSRIALGMPRQAILAMAEDQGVLWLAGDGGVLKYSQKEGTQRFTRHDGLLSQQFQPNAVLKASDGCIYLGTIQGFSSFYPYQIRVNTQQPPVYITQLELGTTPIPVGNWHLPVPLTDLPQLDLWMNDRVFSLSFASLSYCSPEKNMYAYMLEGFDKQWNYVENERKATYTNLPAGSYTFRVKATNNDGIWSDHVATLRIVVHPPYWLTTPAKIAYVVLAIALIWGFIYLRVKLINRRHRREMQQLNEQKEEEMQQARMEFFTTIAHEIRTPVSLIIGPLERLKAAAPAATADAGAASQLEIIDRNAHRLLDLVNQLLDFRKASQQQEMHFQTQNLVTLLHTVAQDFAPSFQNRGLQFSVSLPDERLTAAIDSEGMRKVVSNLLSNAGKYAHSRIGLSAQRSDDGAHIIIEVGDDGAGISAQDMQHVFEPFFQVKGSKAGTGIGLNIVKRITEAHHGTAAVSSEPGRGTTFRITLPQTQAVVDEKPDETAPAASPATPVDNKPRMLIVDDNEDMLTFLVTTFMDQYDVTPARDGEEALRLVGESLVAHDGMPASSYAIVVSDWMMQHMDGPELCHRLRQNPATARMPFILLTAKTDSQSKVEAMEKGVDAFIEKPFAVKYLEACIRNLLSKSA